MTDSSEEFSLNDIINSDNDDLMEGEHTNSEREQVIVYGRDWTIETIFNQIKRGNIDLNPDFQRRNAWNDIKKSKLIEPYLLGYPVPEIVLAENPNQRGSFIVLDGKQRLLTLCGFIAPDLFKTWRSPKINKIEILEELNKKTWGCPR